MHHPTDRITHTTAFVTPVMEHWLEREIAQWVLICVSTIRNNEYVVLSKYFEYNVVNYHNIMAHNNIFDIKNPLKATLTF